MLAENGGEIYVDEDAWLLYTFFDKSDYKRISRTCSHIALETKKAKNWNNFPSNAIVIAANGIGDQIILLPKSDNSKN